MIANHPISFAQNREDILLSGFFDADKKGFYVDVGAEAPTDLSVTKIFYDKGWHGINIEPIKRQYELFINERLRDINLNIGVSNKKGTLEFREYKGSGYSTFSEDMKKEHITDNEDLAKDYRDYKVPVLPLKDIFNAHGVKEIQFLKIDVEGLEYETLEGNDWTKFRPEVICIEAAHAHKDWRSLLKEKGYLFVFFDGLNEYYQDTKNTTVKTFDYIETIIYKEPIVHFKLLEDFQKYDELVAWLDTSKKNLTQEVQNLADDVNAKNIQINSLQNELDEIRSLKKHIKRQLLRRLINIDQKIKSTLEPDNRFIAVPVKRASDDLLKLARENDLSNHQKYNQETSKPLTLKIYLFLRNLFVKAAKKALGIRRKRISQP